MKLASYRTSEGEVRIGALLEIGGREGLVGLQSAHAIGVQAGRVGPFSSRSDHADPLASMTGLLTAGEDGFSAALEALAFAGEQLKDQQVIARWQASEDWVPVEGAFFLPPVPRPGKIISAGANYRKHVAEALEPGHASQFSAVAAELAKVTTPPAISRLPSSLIGHDQPVVYPRWTKQFDYEAELCFFIGKRCKDVPVENALDVVAGYSIFNDVSMRDIQAEEMRRGALLMGKNLDTTGPVGPYLVTPDEIPDPGRLQLTTWVNGDRRQHAGTDEMIFTVADIIAYWSRMTLEPGDMITTGSPGGVGITFNPPDDYLLKPGDVVEIEITGLGRLRNRIVADTAA